MKLRFEVKGLVLLSTKLQFSIRLIYRFCGFSGALLQKVSVDFSL